MRRIPYMLQAALAALLMLVWAASSQASDYNSRFIRNFPPGYYGMWYKAQRFFEPEVTGKPGEEQYRWDKYMTNVTGISFPFFPVPFDWEYGNGRNFNLPDYNTNDWP